MLMLNFLSISSKSEEASMKYQIDNSYFKNVNQTFFFLFFKMSQHRIESKEYIYNHIYLV